MPHNTNDLSKIRAPRPYDPVSAQIIDQPIWAIELRLKQLEQDLLALNTAASFNSIVIPNAPIYTLPTDLTNSVVVNDIVYFNANTGLYEKAQATVTVINGVFTSNPTALGFGVVMSINGATANIMIAGYSAWTGGSQQTAMLEAGQTFVPGLPYYISATQPGKITQFPPTLRIQILLATTQHFIVAPSFSTPESIESLYRVPIGMRPVGSLRVIGPNFTQNVIVGFDGLELYDTINNLWRLTSAGVVVNHQNFGWMIADAVVSTQPASPIYVRIEVAATSGNITMYSASTLAALYDGSSGIFNSVSSLTPLNGNASTLRSYAVQDASGIGYGTITFKFTDADVALTRHMVFKFPDSFQGWKMVFAPITPIASAAVLGGVITSIAVKEGGIGYQTPPTVVITDGSGSGATATAILNDFGSISSILVNSGGTLYSSSPVVSFNSVITSVTAQNGGSGATATATASSGVINTVTIATGGTGYVNPPEVDIYDSGGQGTGAQIIANVQNGIVTSLQIVDGGINYVTPIVLINNAGNRDYAITTPGSFTVNMSGGTVSSVTIGSGGLNYPIGASAHFVGGSPSIAATVSVTVVNGIVTAVTPSGGSGYSSAPTLVIDLKTPYLLFQGGNPSVAATGTLTLPGMGIDHVDISSPGGDYNSATTISLSGGGGTGAALQPVIVGSQIVAVNVINPGTGYTSPPTVTFIGAVNGNNAVLNLVLGSSITNVTLSTPGSGYASLPTVAAASPVGQIYLENGGSNYGSAPSVSISAPDDASGTQATATALLGGSITAVVVTNSGSGYTSPGAVTVTPTGGGGTGLALVPIFEGGALIAVQITNAGSGYTSAPSLAFSGGGGTGAAATATVGNIGSVVAISLTRQGTGYINPPLVTIAAPTSGTQATALARLLGGTVQLQAVMSGYGTNLMPQSAVAVKGNNLQVTTFHNDLDDGTVAFPVPQDCAFYYNIGADPNLFARYPAVPLNKASFLENGTELLTAAYSEVTQLLSDIDADIGLARKTIFWPTFDVNGSPWDQTYQWFILDIGAGGRDAIVQNTGPVGYTDGWWRLWESLFALEPYRSRGWLSINRASQFFESGRVASLGVLSPLKLFDAATGVESSNDGTPLTGQLLLTLDSQVSFLAGPSAQMDLTQTNNLVSIYQNNTGTLVIISSILLTVIFQQNSPGLTPTVGNCAQITAGTQNGNYNNIIGSSTADIAYTRLYAVNQVKELFPDADNAYTMLQPNEQLYIQVANPAGSPIVSQVITAYVKGHTV